MEGLKRRHEKGPRPGERHDLGGHCRGGAGTDRRGGARGWWNRVCGGEADAPVPFDQKTNHGDMSWV